MSRKPAKTTKQDLNGLTKFDTISLYEEWKVGENYVPHEIVKYGAEPDGKPKLFEVIEPHISEPDFTPDTSPLFNKVGFALTGEPLWVRPQGEKDAYLLGSIVSFKGELYINTIPNNVWAPNIHGWARYYEAPEPEPNLPPDVIPEWIQPTGREDTYPLGAFVRYEGKIWESNAVNNSYVPGVLGWGEYADDPQV